MKIIGYYVIPLYCIKSIFLVNILGKNKNQSLNCKEEYKMVGL